MHLQNGYMRVLKKDHPRANRKGYVKRSVLIAEKALGKYLPIKAVAHHVNSDKLDDSNKNLIVCEDSAYHHLIHMRQRAIKACGKADWRKCNYCKEYDDPNNLLIRPPGKTRPSGGGQYHLDCRNEYQRDMRKSVEQLGGSRK